MIISVRFGAITDEALADALHYSSAEDVDIHRMAEELIARRAADLTAAEVEALDGLRKFVHGLLAIGALDRDVRMRGALAVLDRLVKP